MIYDIIPGRCPMFRLTAESTEEYAELEKINDSIERDDSVRAKVLGCFNLDVAARHFQFSIDRDPYEGCMKDVTATDAVKSMQLFVDRIDTFMTAMDASGARWWTPKHDGLLRQLSDLVNTTATVLESYIQKVAPNWEREKEMESK